MEINDELKKLGFSDNKAHVYLTALELGSAPASNIAKKSKLKRTTTYKLLEELVNEGLIEIDYGSKVKTYLAHSPNALVEIFNEKKKSADSILPLLLSKFSQAEYKPTIRFYNGLHGIKKAFEDTLITKEKILYTYSPIKNVLDHFGPTYSRHYLNKRKKLNILRKALRQASDKKSEMETWEFYASDHAVLRQVKFLPAGIEFQTLIQIYDHKISIISFEQDKFAFIIENEELATFMKSIFDLLWQQAKQKQIKQPE